MNLTTLKQEAREPFEDCDDGPMGMPCSACSTALTLIDSLLERCVEEVEKSVVPRLLDGREVDAIGREQELSGEWVGGFNTCRTAVLEAFRRFRGENHGN